MDENKNYQNYKNQGIYGKRPLWQWIGIYLVIAIFVYGLVYYFVFSKSGYALSGQTGSTSSLSQQQQNPSGTAQNNSSNTNKQTEAKVILSQNGFSPATLTVKAGTTVTWVNNSGMDATVNSDPHPIHTDYPPLNLGSFSDGQTLSLLFSTPGTYGYHNHLDPSQRGTIIVQ